MKYEIIDFHTHPFLSQNGNICPYKEYIDLTTENTPEYMKKAGISKMVGSAWCEKNDDESHIEHLIRANDATIKLKEDLNIPFIVATDGIELTV